MIDECQQRRCEKQYSFENFRLSTFSYSLSSTATTFDTYNNNLIFIIAAGLNL